MKNSNKKGFVIPLLLIVAVLVIGGGSVYFLKEKNSQKSLLQNTPNPVLSPSEAVTPSASPISESSPSPIPAQTPKATPKTEVGTLKTFTHSSGAFSLQYPSNLTALEQADVVMLTADSTSNRPLAYFGAAYYPKYLSQFKSGDGVSIRNQILNGYKVSVVNSQSGIWYIFALDDSSDPSSLFVASLSPNTAGYSEKQFDVTLNSLLIDREKTIKLAEGQKVVIQQKALEALLKATMSSIRPSAELYFDEGNGYVGLCSPTGDSENAKMLKVQYQSLVDKVGESNKICLANKEAYAISIKIPGSVIWCIDSTGFNNSVATMIKGYSCK